MENKAYKYILILQVILVTVLLGIPWMASNFGAIHLGLAGFRISSYYELLTLPFGLLYRMDNLSHIFPAGDAQESICDIFVSPLVWLLTSYLWGGLLFAFVRFIRKKTDTIIPPENFWKKVFLSNLLISLVAFSFIFILKSEREISITPISEDAFCIKAYLFCLVAIIGSFMLGILWWLISRLWPNYRLVSIILSAVTITGMLTVIYGVYDLVAYVGYTTIDHVSPEVAAAAEDLTNSINGEFGAPSSLLSESSTPLEPDEPEAGDILWGGPQPHRDSIKAALQFICYDQLELGKYHGSPDDLILYWGMGIRSLFAQADPATRADALSQFGTSTLSPAVDVFAFTSRNGQRLKACFSQFGRLLPEVLPVAVYRRSLAAWYRDNLVATHDYLKTIPHYRDSLKTLYTKMFVAPEELEPQAETYINDIAWAGSLRSIDDALDRGDQQSNRLAVWMVSFWARRYAEGNAAEVYTILRRIGDLYGGTE
ncbi:hypothetical protein [Chitinophaga qingshengii]|uniref:Uncharacterized protein n=1 Tax=Chitinophaga qingshengii TaxID=1569794 RepID=A0ABR7TW79_9BACT|nr:hypothetical protein [Chitinophaga qingshengii]MBC9934741.1 hypothetical protein [Chitinophaga qingshengii]